MLSDPSQRPTDFEFDTQTYAVVSFFNRRGEVKTVTLKQLEVALDYRYDHLLQEMTVRGVVDPLSEVAGKVEER